MTFAICWTVGCAPDAIRACEILAADNVGNADVGIAKSDTGEPRYFLGIGSQGFDAAVTKHTNESKKKHN